MISVILPTFNRDYILSSTIECVQNQTFTDYELIIIDDCSLDKTCEIIQKYSQTDKRIKYIKNIKNIGCARSRKIGYENSRGKFLVFLDDDDTWEADKLMKQYNALMHTNNDVVISDYKINQHNQLIYKNMKKFSTNFKYEILMGPGPFFQSIMIKKHIVDKMELPFDDSSVPSEDWNFFIELSKLNLKINYIPKALFTWNIHENNQSLDLKKEATALSYILNKHYNYIKTICGNVIISNHYRRIARLYEKINNEENQEYNIKIYYTKAFQASPLSFKNIFYLIMIYIGYKRVKNIIQWIRKVRGIPNV